MLSHKNTLRLCTWTAAGLSLLYPLQTFAQGVSVVADANSLIAEGVMKILTAINLITWILFGFLNFLLDPAFMFNTDPSGGGDFMEMLNQIWQLARDLVNIAFAVALVIGAVFTIVKANKSIIDEHLTKFVMALILVNFSWFIPRVILDVANVSTAAIFGIPSMIGDNGKKCEYSTGVNIDEKLCKENPENPGSFTCECALITNMKMFVDNYQQLQGQGWICPASELFCYKSEKMEADTVASFSAILNGLIVNHGRLRELGRVPRKLEGSTNISGLVVFIIREIIVLVLHIGLFFPLLAMTVAFFIRIPILWVTIAFMPFVALKYVLPESITQGYPDKIEKNFLKAAFLPAMVAIPLSIGFIMINAGSQVVGQSGGISIRLFDGVTNLWELMWMCMSMGVLWVGVFEVLSNAGGPIASAAGVIKNAGQSMGGAALRGTAGKLPMPWPGGNTTLAGFMSRFGGGGNPLSNPQVPPTPTSGHAALAARSIADTPAKLTTLNSHLDSLRAALVSGDKNARNRAIAGINTTAGHKVVGFSNPEADVDDLKRKLDAEITARTARGVPNTIPAAAKSAFDTKVNDVRSAARSRRSTDAGFFTAANTPLPTPQIPTIPGTIQPSLPTSVASVPAPSQNPSVPTTINVKLIPPTEPPSTGTPPIQTV